MHSTYKQRCSQANVFQKSAFYVEDAKLLNKIYHVIAVFSRKIYKTIATDHL